MKKITSKLISVLNPRLSENRAGFAYFVIVFSCLPGLANASTALSIINNFLSYLTGPVGIAISTIAIVGVGYACLVLGKVPKLYLVAVVVGVSIIFGASALVSMLTQGG